MLFAAFEIVFFLFVATVLGLAGGWWLASSGKVSVVKAMDRSGAHAAADRELEIARAEIVRLNSKLRVATDAIRELERAAVTTNGEVVDLGAIPNVPTAPAGLDVPPDPSGAAEEASSVGDIGDEPTAAAPDEDAAQVADAVVAADTEAASEDAEPGEDPDGGDDRAALSARSRGGKRLSSRVAEASSAATFERPAPTITFDEPTD